MRSMQMCHSSLTAQGWRVTDSRGLLGGPRAEDQRATLCSKYPTMILSDMQRLMDDAGDGGGALEYFHSLSVWFTM